MLSTGVRSARVAGLMAFDSGAIRYVRFNVVGDAPTMAGPDLIERFAALAMAEADGSSMEIDYGWCGGGHVFDGEFSLAHNVFNDAVHVGFRLDVNRVPAEIKRAYLALEETAAVKTDSSEAAQKRNRKLAKESAKARIEEDLRSGKYRRSKMIHVLWDLPGRSLYAGVTASQREQLCELFERTHGLVLEPIGSGALARRHFETRGLSRAYEEIRPTRFFAGSQGDQPADYPWVVKGDQSKDFLGNEFLVWLWNESLGDSTKVGDHAVSIAFEKSLELDCVFGATGRCTLKSDAPTALAEAVAAARSGKVPRKASLLLGVAGQVYQFALAGEDLSISGLKLPEVENADSPRVLFEERITLLRDFTRWFDQLFEQFCTVRASSSWERTVAAIRSRIGVNAAAVPESAVA